MNNNGSLPMITNAIRDIRFADQGQGNIQVSNAVPRDLQKERTCEEWNT